MKFKIHILLGLLFGCLIHPCSAQQWRKDRYDTRWLPITDVEMTKQTLSSANDAVALFHLYDRARYQHKQQIYFSALQKLRREQPKNVVVLATYCAVIMESNRLYSSHKFKLDEQEATTFSLSRNLKIAGQMDPKLWIVPCTQADVVAYSNGDELEGTKQAVALCREAIRLAPDLSYPQMRLGYWLVNLARIEKTSEAASVVSYKKAQTLLPVNSDASFLLLNVYRFYEPNPAEARKVGQQVIATIPPQVRKSKQVKERLTKQGIKLP